MEKHLEDIEYFKDYKKKLIQFIICNCCYTNGHYKKKRYGRKEISPHNMLGLLLEIINIDRFIKNLEAKI